MAVVIETTLGDLTVDLYTEERPRACLNFLKLCKLKYYNYNLFHNVEHDFIAQTGDPTGIGNGGESVWGLIEGSHKRYFEAESLPKIKHIVPGLLSLVSVGKNLVGSQFFFTLGTDLTSLDGIHCVIGEVAEGHDVLRKLNEAIVDEKYRPYQDIRITHTVILEDPFNDPRGFQIPSRSPSPTPERLKNGRIGADEDINDTEGKTEEEIHELLQEREAKARATILEIVGDLPNADIAPPENVLFVCKLNPITNDDDLEILFSRFGKVKGCEVIRDKFTGDSLQYAFVEFEDKKACENAYFKMDNVLIDDRRIHVDFSQSVAKVKWRGKGRGVIHQDSKEKLDFDNLRGSKTDKRKHFEVKRSRRRSCSRSSEPKSHGNRNRGPQSSREHHNYDKNRRDSNLDRPSRNHHSNRNLVDRRRSRSPRRYSNDKSSNPKDRRKSKERSVKSSEMRKKEVDHRTSRDKHRNKDKKRKHRSPSSNSTSSSSNTRKKQSKKRKKQKRRASSSSSTSSSSN